MLGCVTLDSLYSDTSGTPGLSAILPPPQATPAAVTGGYQDRYGQHASDAKHVSVFFTANSRRPARDVRNGKPFLLIGTLQQELNKSNFMVRAMRVKARLLWTSTVCSNFFIASD